MFLDLSWHGYRQRERVTERTCPLTKKLLGALWYPPNHKGSRVTVIMSAELRSQLFISRHVCSLQALELVYFAIHKNIGVKNERQFNSTFNVQQKSLLSGHKDNSNFLKSADILYLSRKALDWRINVTGYAKFPADVLSDLEIIQEKRTRTASPSPPPPPPTKKELYAMSHEQKYYSIHRIIVHMSMATHRACPKRCIRFYYAEMNYKKSCHQTHTSFLHPGAPDHTRLTQLARDPFKFVSVDPSR